MNNSNNLLFENLDISPEIKKALLEMEIFEATQVQTESIEPMLSFEDILVQAPTGTGKTFAFGIPIAERICEDENTVQALVLCPTRELAIQITNEINKLTKYKKKTKALAIYGGQNIEIQISALRDKPQIIVATPGRLMDHLKRKKIFLSSLTTVVLDEADEMLNMGFRDDIETILKNVPDGVQTAMFSATLSPEILEIAKKFQKQNARKIKITKKEVTVSTVKQYYLEVKNAQKTDLLKAMIDINKYELVLVFCNTKKRVDELCEELSESGYLVGALHGDMKQLQRDRVMNKFRGRYVNILVATDVCARGIDVDDIDAVFNYDIPLDDEYYVHRIGRTGRANKEGIAYTFLSNKEMWRLREIMKYTKTTILPQKRPSLDEVEYKKAEEIIKKAIEISKTEDISYFCSLLEEKQKEDKSFDINKITASLLYMKLKPQKIKQSSASGEKEKAPKREKTKKDDVARLFFNVGSLDKVRRRNIEDLFNDHPTLRGIKVENIDVFDKYSFVDVPYKDAKEICDNLCGMTFKGRILSVDIALTEKKASDKKNESKKTNVQSREKKSRLNNRKEKNYRK